jgi:hypothetical protein
MHFYTDVQSGNAIKDDPSFGSYLVDGNTIYLPLASGTMNDGRPSLTASIERYRWVEINHHSVLMRDDAWQAFRESNKLYDYGILIKVSEDDPLSLDSVKHPSIKLLYADPMKSWADPFVHGANER